jgi:hypothetical protein
MCPPSCSTVTRTSSFSMEVARRPRYRVSAILELLCIWYACGWRCWPLRSGKRKLPSDWTDAQIGMLLHDSPWAQMAEPAPAVQVYLATAHPVREAEAELARRRGKPLSEEYVDYLAQEGANKLVVAIAYKNSTALADDEEAHRMEEESIMRVGRQKYKMEGHFPPVPSDPFLRLVYPARGDRAGQNHHLRTVPAGLRPLPRRGIPGARHDVQREAGNVVRHAEIPCTRLYYGRRI